MNVRRIWVASMILAVGPLGCGPGLPRPGEDAFSLGGLTPTLVSDVAFNGGDDANGCGALKDDSDPHVQGLQFFQTWSVLEKQRGVFDFTCLDKWLADAHAHGKKVVITGKYMNTGTGCGDPAVQEAPGWLYQLLGLQQTACSQSGTSSAYLVPNYWNPTFIAEWQNLLTALGKHLALSPYRTDVEYFRGMLGKGGELMFCKGGLSDTTCVDKLKAFSPHGANASDAQFIADWAQWLEARLAFEKAALGQTAWVVAIVDPWSHGFQVPGCARGSTALCSYAAEVALSSAAKGGFIIGSNAISGTSDPDGIKEIDEYAAHHFPIDSVLFQFQSLGGIGPNAAEASAEARAVYCFSDSDDVVKRHASMEWYAGDAADPTDTPALDSLLAWENGGPGAPSCSGL